MATIEQLGRRLGSLNELRSLVRSMKALSAASIRQYEQAVNALADYYRTVELGLHVVLRDRVAPAELQPRGEPAVAAVVFGSDHGLCGRINEDLAGFAMARLQGGPGTERPCLVLAVGSRVAAQLEHAGLPVQADFIVPGSAARIAELVQQVLLKIDEWRTEQGVERVRVFYSRHLSTTRYSPVEETLLPVDLGRLHRLEEAPWPSRVLPAYDLDRERLFSTLLRQYFFVTLCRACAESLASEHGSRLSAMRTAERNLEERIDEVGTQFRQARQGEITAELLDVVGGFEALSLAGGRGGG